MTNDKLKRLETELFNLKLQQKMTESGQRLNMRPSAVADAVRAAEADFMLNDDLKLVPRNGITGPEAWLTNQVKTSPHWFGSTDQQTGKAPLQPWQITRTQAADFRNVQQAQQAAQDAGRLSFEIIDDD